MQSEISGPRDRRQESELIVFKIAIAALIASTAVAHAESCPRPDTLGTARVLTVDPKTTPRVGTQSFPDTLPLAVRVSSVDGVEGGIELAFDTVAPAREQNLSRHGWAGRRARRLPAAPDH